MLKLATATAEARILLHEAIDVHSFARQPTTSLEMNGLARASVKLDRALALLPYRANRDLGGFILIDRFTNETVAFGLIEDAHDPAAAQASPEAAEVSAPASLTQWLAHALLPDRDPWLLLAATSILPILLVWLISYSPTLTLVFALAELVQRPLVGWLLGRRFKRPRRAPDSFNLDGEGI